MNKKVAWVLGVFVLVVASSWLVGDLDHQAKLNQQTRALDTLGLDIESRFFHRHREELTWLAGREVVRAGLGHPEQRPFLRRYLAEISGLLSLDVTYLIDSSGVIVVASSPNYEGVNVGFREYFRDGMGGRAAYALTTGVVTGTKGLYASVPVFVEGRPAGVLAFRTSGLSLDRHLKAFPGVAVIDAEGRVFAPAEFLATDPPAWIRVDDHRVSITGTQYLLVRRSLDVFGVSLVSLQEETWPWASWAVALLVDLLVLAIVGLVWVQRRQQNLRRAEDRQRHLWEVLLANLLEGIAVLNGQGRVVWTNPAFARLAQLEGSSAPSIGELWDRPGTEPWGEVLEGRQSWVVFESVLRGRQGGWTPVLAGFTAAEGQFLLSVLDRSEGHRSDQLLRHSQKLTVLGQLSGGIAHDLNNMLGVLMGMVDLMKMTLPEQDPLQESVDLMQASLSRAAALADRMLNFARRTPMARNPLDITALLRELRFLARTALHETIQTEVLVDEGPIIVQGDENLLLSAFLNLVLNAGDAMATGGLVRVIGRREGNLYHVIVEDQGAGMDTETLSRIFEPFFTTKSGQKGTGLGLALVRRTILDHQGTITVKSEHGLGTRVTVVLPVQRDQVSALPAPG